MRSIPRLLNIATNEIYLAQLVYTSSLSSKLSTNLKFSAILFKAAIALKSCASNSSASIVVGIGLISHCSLKK